MTKGLKLLFFILVIFTNIKMYLNFCKCLLQKKDVTQDNPFQIYSDVFKAIVLSITNPNPKELVKIKLSITDVYRSELLSVFEEVEVFTPKFSDNECAFNFLIDEEYLIYTNNDRYLNICGHSCLLKVGSYTCNSNIRKINV
jgi:hypothetical protein